ncbi:MAG: S8 family serine peptidase [Candidatus Cloacimonetes bacterium]|nr:S8 family serine peptidase [Candidatus Cloacimonadota bacterium]
MKVRLLLVMIFLTVQALSGNTPDRVPREMIVRTGEVRQIRNMGLGLADFDQFLSDNQAHKIKPITNKSDNRYYVISFMDELDWDEINAVEFEGIDYIQPNYINRFNMMPNDTYFVTGDQWALHQEDGLDINAVEAWDYTTGSSQIIIGLVDSGLHFDHPDIQQNVFYNDGEIPDDGIDNDENGYVDDWRGWDFVDAAELVDIALGDYIDQDNDPTDDLNHGTHLAGIIAADTNNEQGVAGICWHARILVIRAGFKTVDGVGYLQDDDAAAGIIYAADMGADVVNVSWGDDTFSQIIGDACSYAYQKGTIIVASSGNTYGPGIMYPAYLSTTISVGSVDHFFQRASFSSYGPQLDLVAPGVSIFSSYGNDEDNYYKEQSGTSMSAPFVTASIALLLSVESGFSFNQIRTRLNSSCFDLGTDGYDNEYGNGLLDIEGFLTNTSCPILEITYPTENSGFSQNFDIIGTVLADNFSKYTVMYTTNPIPSPMDWLDVTYPHSNTPVYKFIQADNEVLATFDIQGISPEFDEYRLKLEVMTTDNKHYDTSRNIFIDKTEPTFYDSLAGIMKRYDGEYVKYYLQAVFNEPIYAQIYYSPQDGPRREVSCSNFADSVQIIYIPRPEMGDEDIFVDATNICGLEIYLTPQDHTYMLPDDFESIAVNDYIQELGGNMIVAARKPLDVDGNGFMEFLALEFDEDGNQNLRIFEFADDELIIKTSFSFDIWPQDIGYTAPGDFTILGVDGDLAMLYNCEAGSLYPNHLLWVETNVYGGSLIDFDNDGIDDIAIIKNENIGNTTQRVLALYKRYTNGILKLHTILNQTPTSFKNEFVNRIYCGNLDGDVYQDLLLSDTDGDILIIEKDNYPNEYEVKFYHRLPVGNAYYAAMGDFTGDGLQDFCVGGFSRNYADPYKTFSFFEFFTSTAVNDEYISLGYLSFDQVEAKNSIANADLDGDGDDEIILCLPPNAYIIDYVNGQFKPVWKGDASITFQNTITAISASEFENGKALLPLESAGDVHTSLITKAADFTGPPTPGNFTVQPLNENSARLCWGWEGNFDFFNIYRQQNGAVELLDSVTDLRYTDTGLSLGDTLTYQITLVDSQFYPAESRPTLWKQAVPMPVPQIVSIRMAATNILRVEFDQMLNNDAIGVIHYKVNNNVGRPVSVNFIIEKKGLIMTFLKPLPDFGDYELEITGITGNTGVPFPDSVFPFDHQSDTEPPSIIAAHVKGKQVVKIYFSEAIQEDDIIDLDNYSLVPPSTDSDNEIVDLVYHQAFPDSFFVEVFLLKEMEYSRRRYFLKVSDIHDLVGNVITNNGNKCRFSLTDITDLDNVKVYPNPFYPATDTELKFVQLPLGEKGNIWIYDLSGEIIYHNEFGPLTDSEFNNIYSWNGKNGSGNKVSSGIYFYVMRMGSAYKKGKFALIN